jgi:hypothetical protein
MWPELSGQKLLELKNKVGIFRYKCIDSSSPQSLFVGSEQMAFYLERLMVAHKNLAWFLYSLWRVARETYFKTLIRGKTLFSQKINICLSCK